MDREITFESVPDFAKMTKAALVNEAIWLHEQAATALARLQTVELVAERAARLAHEQATANAASLHRNADVARDGLSAAFEACSTAIQERLGEVHASRYAESPPRPGDVRTLLAMLERRFRQ